MELTKKEQEVFDLIDNTYNNFWHSTSDLIIENLAIEIVRLLPNGYVKMKEPCYLDGSFDNEGYLIGGKFTDVYLKIEELESKRI